MRTGKGTVRFPAATVALKAGADALQVTIEGDESEVERMKGVVATHLDRFAFREAPLRFDWSSPKRAERTTVTRTPMARSSSPLRG